MSAADVVAEWEQRGAVLDVDGRRVFVLDVPAATDAGKDPLLVLHGFPSSSIDWRHVLDELSADRRVVLLDYVGFGFSDKPDLRYGIRMYADIVESVVAQLGLARVALVTHDLGDSIGGELLARDLDGGLGFEVSERVITNGSIYMDLVQLSAGQQMLLSLEDARVDLAAVGIDPADGYKRGLAATFSPACPASDDELEVQWLVASRNDGHQLLARTIRYIEDRRKEERRYTGPIETHPSPLGIVWGVDDPIAVVAMAERLGSTRADSRLVLLDGVGHYPMVEAPERFGTVVRSLLR